MKRTRQNRRVLKADVPEWAYDAVWYQIFPERFRNGDRNNDPRLTDFSDDPVPGWRVLPWGWDWYALDEWERQIGNWNKSVYMRRFGGDLIGIREKLDYLQELGINAIYLNPIFWSPSLHKYDAICLHHVDPTLGPDREGDLQRLAAAGETHDPKTWIWTASDLYFVDLVREIHRRGMRIILDGVFNHVGVRFFAFEDLRKRGRDSPYASWFRIRRWRSDGSFDYAGWFGHLEMPEFARTRRDLAAPVRRYIFNVVRRWMDPLGNGDRRAGIDGWRLDVAFCVPHGFWRRFRRYVKRINPDAYLTGEIVTRADAYLRGDEFDAVMNYAWLYPTLRFFSPSNSPYSAEDLRSELDKLRAAYPAANQFVLQNLLDSHDLGRIATVLENKLAIREWESLFHQSSCAANPKLLTRKPSKRTYQILRQLVLFQMTYVGAPMIYYGTEVGMWGGNDPDNRQPMLWDDIRYQPERYGPNERRLSVANRRQPDMDLYAFYQKAIKLRKQLEALRRGELVWLDARDSRILAFWRLGSPKVLAVFNASEDPRDFCVPESMWDVWNSVMVEAGLRRISPRGWLILTERARGHVCGAHSA